MPEARVDRLEAALQRLADAQAQTQGELRALAEAQRRTEERLETLIIRVDQLAEAQRRTEERLDQLAEAQRRTEERLETLIVRVDQLAEAQRRTEERLDQLAEAQRRTEERLEALVIRVDRLTDVVAWLKGDALELRYRERATSYFHRILSGIRLVARDELQRLAEEAEGRGVLSSPEYEDLLLSDVVVQGRLRDRAVEAYLVAEVSSVLDSSDVERARRRAELLERVVGLPVVAVVAGEHLTPEADLEAARLRMWRVLDGRVIAPQ